MQQLRKFFVSLALLLSVDSYAVSIDLIANKTAVNIGDSVEVAVRISGLDDASAPSIGVYDLNFQFDNSLFSVDSISWGDSTKGNQLDLSGFGSLQDTTSGSGRLNLFELSFDDALDLNNLQAGEFTLFSVLLNTLAAGTGNFSLITNSLGDAYGSELFVDRVNDTHVNVASVSVPEPSSILLLLAGLIVLVSLRAKLSQSEK